MSQIVRNNKKKCILFYLPAFLGIDLLTSKDIKSSILSLPLVYFIFSYCDLIEQKMKKNDKYQDEAIDKLKKLVSLLKELNVNTDYGLLLKSNLYAKVNNLYFNENKIPEIMTSKYILVPSYNYEGDIKNSSILQEHIVGSNNYILSIGSMNKEHKLVYSHI